MPMKTSFKFFQQNVSTEEDKHFTKLVTDISLQWDISVISAFKFNHPNWKNNGANTEVKATKDYNTRTKLIS